MAYKIIIRIAGKLPEELPQAYDTSSQAVAALHKITPIDRAEIIYKSTCLWVERFNEYKNRNGKWILI